MGRKNVVHVLNRILLTYKGKPNHGIRRKIDGSEDYYVEYECGWGDKERAQNSEEGNLKEGEKRGGSKGKRGKWNPCDMEGKTLCRAHGNQRDGSKEDTGSHGVKE